MIRNRLPRLALLPILLALAVAPAEASFHVMQIEQVIGGVCGDVTQQAIQLRMRSEGQNLVSGARLVAWDETGSNPVVVIDFPTNVAIGATGSRVLSESAAFDTAQSPNPTSRSPTSSRRPTCGRAG